MIRSRPVTLIDYSQQLAVNLDELQKRERLNINDVVDHGYLRRVFHQYESFGLQSDTLLFCTVTALGAISYRAFIKRLDNVPIMLNHGSLIVGKTGSNKSSYIKLIRHGINTLEHHYKAFYHPDINKNANKIDIDQVPQRQDQELSSTSSKMLKASFMTEVCTELAVTKNLATTDTFLCHDEGDVILSTFGFYSPSDSKHAGGVNLFCSALDGLSNYSRTTGRQSIHVENSNLSMLLATTGSKMYSTLQVMHQKNENVGVLGRLNIWHLSSSQEFIPPRDSKLIPDIASIDHLLIIAHEIFQHCPEFRFKKHASDVTTNHVVVADDAYMTSLRLKQGIADQNEPNSFSNNNEHHYDVFDICPSDLTDDGGAVSAFKLMISILNSDFKIAQQMDEHLIGCVRKGPNKFPRTCSLLCLLEIIGDIASNLLKYIVFDEGDFSRPHSKSNKFISTEFVNAARQYVINYLTKLPIIDGRPIIYIDKSQVERAYILYTYVETTTQILFDASLINHTNPIDKKSNPINDLSKKEKREISWIMKVLKTPVIFFSNNYLCKSIPGCPGSGVFKNAATDLRKDILNLMKTYGLLMCDHFLSATMTDSYCKAPPSVLRQNEDLIKLFTMFGTSFTLNIYEEMFENFGLVTASDATIVPITPTGVELLRENNSFINFYHCLDKDQRVLDMIQERIALKEINRVYYYNNGPYRYEPIIENGKFINVLSNKSNDNNNENVNNDTSSTTIVHTTHHLQKQSLYAVGFDQREQRSNTSSVHNEVINVRVDSNTQAIEQQRLNTSSVHNEIVNVPDDSNTQAIEQQMSLPSFPINNGYVLDLAPADLPQPTEQIQRKKNGESPVSISSRSSISSISSLTSVDFQGALQSTPVASSPLPSMFFQSILNINESLTTDDIPIDDLSSIIGQQDSTQANSIMESSEIMLQLPSPTQPFVTSVQPFISATQPFVPSVQPFISATQPFVPSNVHNNMDILPIASSETDQNDPTTQQINNDTNKSCASQSMITPQLSTNSHNQIDLISPLFSDQLQTESNTSEHVSSDASSIELPCISFDSSIQQLENSSPIAIAKKKRGRKSNIDKDPSFSSVYSTETSLANHKHPIYKRLILLDGIVFSKTNFTHALQQFPNLRDDAIKKLCQEGIFIKDDVFAKKTSTGSIEFLEGYVKRSLRIDDNTPLNIEDCINFGNLLATYDITVEEYVNSFNNKQPFVANSEHGFVKRILSKSDIKLRSYLFSSKLVDLIHKDSYFSQRFAVDDNAVCSNTPSMEPTTSNTLTDEYQQMQYDQARQHHQTKKRAYNQILDNVGPAPKSSRRRP